MGILSVLLYPFLHPWLFLKLFLPKSLFGRSLIILLTPLLCVQVILGYIFFDRHTETILRLLSNTIAGDIALVVDWIENDTKTDHIKNMSQQNLALEFDITPEKHLNATGLEKDTWLYSFMGEALDEKIKRPYHLRMDSDTIFIKVDSSKGLIDFKTSRKL